MSMLLPVARLLQVNLLDGIATLKLPCPSHIQDILKWLIGV